jgi:large subunit ribosomal protein L10
VRYLGIRRQKELKVEEIKGDLDNSRVVVLTDYRGLTVAQISSLRRILREEGVKYRVVKNTLTRLAVRDVGLDNLVQYLDGPTAIAYGYDDPVLPVKLLVKFAKENENLTIKGGALEKNVLNESELRRISELPSKEVLLAKTLGCLQSPIAGLLNVLNGNIRNLVYVLSAVKEKKESSI